MVLFSLSSRSERSGRDSGFKRTRQRLRPAVESLESRLAPATFTVQNLANSGIGSLRQAILDAGVLPEPNVIVFAPSVTGTLTLTAALPDLPGTLDIRGPGATTLTVARSTTAPGFRLMTVPAASNVTITGLTLTDGSLTATGAAGDAEGAAILNLGTLTLRGCVLSDNVVLASRTASGGAVSNHGTLEIDGCTIADNRASSGTSLFGSALGGGIFSDGTLTLRNSTVANNQAAGTTSKGSGAGGGIFSSGTTLVEFSTVTGNANYTGALDVLTGGGGIRVSDGSATLRSTLVAGNTNYYGTPSDVDGAFMSLGHNLIGNVDNSTGLRSSTDRYGTSDLPLDARLGPLQDNGGPTPTVALLSGSQAIDGGTPDDFPATDQRGVDRPADGDANGLAVPDIGAFEAPTGTSSIPEETFRNQLLVTKMYVDLLGRQPDPIGLSGFVTVLNRGATAFQVAAGIQTSEEFLTRTVNALYQQYLGRPADTFGLEYHVGLLQDGVRVEAVAAGILASPEYYRTQGGSTDTGFLRAIYLDVLGRPIDESGSNSSLSRGLEYLRSGGTRLELARILLTSEEGRTVQVNLLYQQYLHRAADSGGLAGAVASLRAGGTLQNLTAGIIGSPEYAARA